MKGDTGTISVVFLSLWLSSQLASESYRQTAEKQATAVTGDVKLGVWQREGEGMRQGYTESHTLREREAGKCRRKMISSVNFYFFHSLAGSASRIG